MAFTTKDDEQSYYICGQCNDKIYHLKSDQPVIPCPDCGWNHGAKMKYDIPPKIKFNLADY